MVIWTVANQKGGVGKTTTSVALAGIATELGKNVLLIDLDPHGSLTSYFNLEENALTRSAYTLFENRKALAREIIENVTFETSYKGISVMPSTAALATLERQGIGDGMGLVLTQAFGYIRESFDLVIIDCPPQLGVLLVNALAACDKLIIPVQTEFLAIKGLERILNTLNMLFKSTKRNIERVIVPTMYDRRTQASVSSLRTIRNDFGEAVWPGKIPIDTRFRDASKAGVPPHLYDTESRGVSSYRSLYKYLNT